KGIKGSRGVKDKRNLSLCNTKYLTMESIWDIVGIKSRRNFSSKGLHSMLKRIAAIVLILCCTSVAWVILGTTIFARTYNVGSTLSDRVVSTWGGTGRTGSTGNCLSMARRQVGRDRGEGKESNA